MKKRTVGIAFGMTAVLCVASVTGALLMANREVTAVSAELSTEETEATEALLSETEAAQSEEIAQESAETESVEEDTEIETEEAEDKEPKYLSVAFQEEDAWAQVAITNSDYVETGVVIRSAPDSESEVLGYLYKGTAVWVLDRGEAWTEFYSNGITGYVMTDYLLFNADVEEIADVYGAKGVRAEWNDVNIYTSDDAAVIMDTMDAGEVYQIVNDYGHWIEIWYNEDTTAYVSSEDVTRVVLFESATPKDGERVELVEIYSETCAEETEADTDTYTYTETYTETEASSSQGSSSSGSSSSGSSSSGSSSSGSSSSGSSSSGSSSSGSSSSGSSSSGSTSSGSSSSGSSSSGTSSSGSSSSSSTQTEATQTETTATEAQQTETAATEATQTETSSSSSSSSSDDEGYYDADTDTYYDGDGNVISTASYDASTTETAAAASVETVYTEAETVYTEAETTAWTEAETTAWTEAETTASTETEATATSTSVSTDDTTLLAALIYCEAGNQSYDGMVAVGAVVMNRVSSASFPNTISEVIYQSGQFSPASSGALATAIANGVPSTCYTAAAAAIAGEDPTGGALYFNTTANKGIQIGDHWFY